MASEPRAARPQLGLRAKLSIGFGGILLMLLISSLLSVLVLNSYSHTFDRILRENYASVTLCEEMKSTIDTLNEEAERTLIETRLPSPIAVAAIASARFDDLVTRQFQNSTLPLEPERTADIVAAWKRYQSAYDRFQEIASGNLTEAAAFHRQTFLPLRGEVRSAVQVVSQMNLKSMVAVENRTQDNLNAVRTALLALAAAGSAIAVLYAGIMGPAMLRPLSILTRSAGQIADGNWDQSVDIRSRDELGQLAGAFNVMAARLREFRRLNEERLIRTEQTTQMAIDSLPDAIAVLSPSGEIELANRAAVERFGISPGRRDDRLKWMYDLHEQVMRTGQPVDFQGYRSAIQRFDGGDERFYLPHATPLKSAEGIVIGVTAILSDVTRLKQTDEARSNLVSTVSHELKTPLTSLRMSTHMLADEQAFGPLSDEQRVLLQTARDNAERLHRTVENLLGIGRLESGTAPLELRPMPAADLIDQAVEPLRPLFAARGVALRIEPPPADIRIGADPRSIGYVLTNFLTNAANYAPPGSVVEVRCEVAADAVEFSVKDAGPGIPPEHVPRLFEKFYRVPRASGPTGAGLGLAIARDVVEAHGGRIGVETTQGQGARFYFTLARSSAE